MHEDGRSVSRGHRRIAERESGEDLFALFLYGGQVLWEVRMNRWRSVLIMVGIVLIAVGGATLIGGGVGLWANQQRDRDGFFSTGHERFTTDAFALSLPWIAGEGDTAASFVVFENMLGDLRIRVASTDPAVPLFIGIGAAADVSRYLDGVGHDEVSEIQFAPFKIISLSQPGAGPAVKPAGQTFWVASDTGTGPRTLTWDAGAQGDWIIVVMNADGSAGIDTDLSTGATLSGVLSLTIGALIAGGVLLTTGVAVIILTITARPSTPRVARGW